MKCPRERPLCLRGLFLSCKAGKPDSSLSQKDGRIVTIGKSGKPDAERTRIHSNFGIDWKSIYAPVRSEVGR